MIKIRIKKSKHFKDTSKYSAYVPDNSLYYDTLSQMSSYFYDDINELWEIPENKVQELKDRLSWFEYGIENEELLSVCEFNLKTKAFSHQIEAIYYGMEHNKFHLGDEQGLGKALTLDTKILTPDGFKLMKDIQSGNSVIGQNGMPTKVLRTYYHENKNIYKITFSDNTFIKCCDEHLWEVRTSNDIRRGTKKVLTTKELLKDFKLKYNLKYYIPMVEPVQFNKKDLPLNPYLLGCLIGDGSLTGTSVGFTSCDSFIVDKLNSILAPDYFLHSSASMDKINYNIISTSSMKKINKIRKAIIDLKLNCNAHCKFIPDIYKYNDVESRLQLLQGLMDTDGYVSKNGTLQYCSCSERLCDDVGELIQSLGGVYTKHKRTIKNKYVAYELTFKLKSGLYPVTLPRKLNRVVTKRKYEPIRLIKNIEYIGQEPAKCITVESDDGLYVIENYIVTHNTKECIDIAVLRKQKYNYQHCLVICGVATLKWNWKDEIETHSNEKCWIIGCKKNKIGKNKGVLKDKGNAEKLEQLKNIPEPYFWVINIEALRDANIVKILQKYCKLGIINMIIGEEIHKMKNPTCSQSKGFLKLNADCQISVSGTPLVNNPVDLFVLFKWHGIETHTYTAFKNRYCVFGGFAGREIIGYQHLKELKDTLNKIQLRRYKKDVLDLPNKLPQTVYVEMGKQQEKIYNEVLLDLQKNIDLIMLNPNPLSQLTRLRQATACPSLLSSTISESVKLDKLEELVAEIAKNGEQCLVFSNWAQVCEIAAERLKKYNAKTYTGLTKNLKAVETEFKENKKITALIGTIKQMGTGLTFTNCNYVIFLDSPWTQADKDQCIDRTHRIGQTKDVTIITLVCANTIDEKVEKIVKTKGLLSNAIVDNVKAMNNRDLLDFLLF